MASVFARLGAASTVLVLLCAAVSVGTAQAQNVIREALGKSVAAPGNADYDQGFRDGLNKQASRDRDRSNRVYAEGFKAGQAKSAAIATSGPDFELGYRDAFNKASYRDSNRSNRGYANGYKAGQTELATVTSPATPTVVAAAVPASADYQSGYRDALNQQAYRDRDRSNKGYAEGFKAGQAKSVAIAAAGPDFERGFRDGLNKADYRDRDRSNKGYADGYKAGQKERDAPAMAVPRPGTPRTAALPPPTRPSDLIGRSAADLDSGMKALGYTRYGGFTKGSETFSTWGGAPGNQCARTVVRDGKVTEVTGMGDSAESSSCR